MRSFHRHTVSRITRDGTACRTPSPRLLVQLPVRRTLSTGRPFRTPPRHLGLHLLPPTAHLRRHRLGGIILPFSDIDNFEPTNEDDFDKKKIYNVFWIDPKEDGEDTGNYDAQILMMAENREELDATVAAKRIHVTNLKLTEQAVDASADNAPVLPTPIVLSMEMGSSLSSDEEGPTESSSVTEGCSSASEVQEPQPGTSTSKPRDQRRAQKRKRMSANEKFQSALLEQQGKLISALENATQVEQSLRERQVAAQEKLVDLFSKYFNK
ncbi:hypothetical protein MTO96_034684 [Rhipicephalus appendiculatus]